MALLPFRLILPTGAALEGPVGRGEQSHPKVFLSLCWCSPAAFLPPLSPAPACSQASLDAGALAILGYHQGINTSQAISGSSAFSSLPSLPTASPSPRFPCSLHAFTPSPANPIIPGSQASSPPHLPSMPASSLSSTLCPGTGLTFAALNSALLIHPLPSLLVNSFASLADACLQEKSMSSCPAMAPVASAESGQSHRNKN